MISKRFVIETSFIAIVSFFLFSFLNRHATLPDPDAFYHAKMALILRDGTVLATFPWLPDTTLARGFADQQLLYHALLIPFVSIFSSLWGVKIASVILSTFAMLSFYILVRSFAPSLALAATLTLPASQLFLFRLLLGKAQPLALGLLFLFLYALFRKRAVLVFIFAFLLPLTHGSWPIGAGVALFFLFFERRTAIIALCGFALGFLAHPAFPNTLTFFWDQTIRIALLGLSLRHVGGEWYGSDILDFFIGAPFVTLFLALSLPLLFITLESRRITPRSFVLFALASVMAILTVRARRSFEFFTPLATIAFASIAGDALGNFPWQGIQRRVTTFLQRPLGIIVAIACASILIVSIQRTDALFRDGYPLTYLQHAAAFLERELPPNTMVVLSNWSVFPQLFFATRHLHFSMGLDPRFLLMRNPAQFAAWEDIFLARGVRVSRLLANNFHASYLLVTAREEALLKKARSDYALRSVYEDDEATVFTTL